MTTPPELDDVVAAWLQARFQGGEPLAAAVVTPDRTGGTVRGAPADGTFEIGSVTKGLTGLLYVDAVDRGELTPTATLGDLLPLAGTAAAAVTVEQLSRHRSGLPSVPPAMRPLRRTWSWLRHGRNPYGDTLDELLEHARLTKVGKPGPMYSNMGFQLLGHAVAAAAGTTYAALLDERVVGPLGLPGVSLPAAASELGPTAVPGRNRRGRLVEPWTGEALGPAGGVRAPLEALVRLARALLDGSAPGLRALDPVADFGKARIGAAWITSRHAGRMVTWHNGGTGGFRSWLGLDRSAGTAAVVLRARSVSVDKAGFALLDVAG